MERKLSQKAAQMRQRLFTRNTHGRSRAATMNSSAPAISTPNSRSRSATTPDFSVPVQLAWDNTDATRYYHFTDEPGYFRPASPLLDRQEVEEDLEDNVKHACALLVECIERGLPIWPSFHTQQNGLAQAPVYETRSNLQDQMTQLSLSPVALDTLIPAQTGHWDSDVNATLQSSGNYGPCQNSFNVLSGAGRFYGRRLSTSPLEEPELDEERGRARGRSFATDTTCPRSRSRSRSRSSSPGDFPYSPPQVLDTAWGRDTTQIFESDDQLFPTEDGFLGAEGMNWLRASLDQNNSDRESDWASSAQIKRGCMTSAPNTASGPAPRRFYSMRQSNKSKDVPTKDWDAFEVHGSRESGIYRGLSMRNLSMEEERKRANDFSYPVWMDRGSDSPNGDLLRGKQSFYSEVQDGGRQRRKRASELLKKLTGLGMRRKDTDVESRRPGRTVEAMA
ncbi:uncharacterized protein N7483_002628 [Penicillium malachiteum]|uniref:uncharacterized protein n=1 Tax=Penicillium malachiteum TaxID=1324776 RepID=UPI0025466780|nr:uncharacterized protein N7483_002628 [Penicillium malachiteum]KAJ5737503.1 hypothetical protein N7483_002628 [Penicillium malachiteum]